MTPEEYDMTILEQILRKQNQQFFDQMIAWASMRKCSEQDKISIKELCNQVSKKLDYLDKSLPPLREIPYSEPEGMNEALVNLLINEDALLHQIVQSDVRKRYASTQPLKETATPIQIMEGCTDE